MKFFRKKWKKIILVFLIIILIIGITPFLVFYKYKKKIYLVMDDIPHHQVAIVYGAAVKPQGEPSDVLEDRLITASKLYEMGKVDKILVSGDNRFESYNEPQGMYDYLVNEREIPSVDVIRDFAGRRTYDTCIRAKEIFGVESAVLISQGYHVPRALFICNAMGIESVGYSATRQDYVMGNFYKLREIAAIFNAIIDVYIWQPSYVGGEKEFIFDEWKIVDFVDELLPLKTYQEILDEGISPGIDPDYEFPISFQYLNGCFAFAVNHVLIYKYEEGIDLYEAEDAIDKPRSELWTVEYISEFLKEYNLQMHFYDDAETFFKNLKNGEPVIIQYKYELEDGGWVGHIVAAYSFDEEGVWITESISGEHVRIDYGDIFNDSGQYTIFPFSVVFKQG